MTFLHLALAFLLFTLPSHFLLADKKLNKEETLTKDAAVRKKEQAKFIGTFSDSKEFLEAWGLFSYGGFSDDGQFQIFEAQSHIHFHYAEASLLSGKKSSQDGHLKYKKFRLQKTSSQWLEFNSNLQKLEKNLAPFRITHFDGRIYDFLWLRKNKEGVITSQRVYFDDPFLRMSETKSLQKLLSLFKDFSKPTIAP